jgi:putative pyruvate formate lyase activating enzyme
MRQEGVMKQKAYVLPDGQALFIDPRLETLPLIRELCPGYNVPSVPAPEGFDPNIKKLAKPSLESKIELARKTLLSCDLCGWKCEANRHVKSGPCGLGAKAFCSEPFLHIGLEDVINPGVSIQMCGCGMRCAFCQAHDHVEGWQGNPDFMELNKSVWSLVDWKMAHSLEFVGGDPNPSIPGILEFLSFLDLSIPVVWDDNCFGSESAYELLDQIIDIYLSDFKFGNSNCARKLAGIDNYWETATAALRVMMEQDARIIVRLLVIPSHWDCCQKKILRWLSLYRDRIWLSIMAQYLPLHRASQHPEVNRLATREEIAAVERLAGNLGLRDVNKNPEKFWD